MMGKPAGGDRPITLTAGLYRCWSMLRKAEVTKWEASKAGHWDSAIRGSDARRAALVRATRAEVANELGAAV
eukprot:1026374-Lingulodinium_polyedra.AAC.1